MLKIMSKSRVKMALSTMILGAAMTACGTASDPSADLAGSENPPLRPGEMRRISKIVSDAGQTFAVVGPTIPQNLLKQARCIAVLRAVQAGFIFGGTGGDGVATCRMPGGTWSAPTFLGLGGASVGLQIGGGVVESVLLFMNDAGVNMLENAQFTLNAGAGVIIGPVGRIDGSGVSQNSNILAYSRGVGFQARLAVDGTVIGHDIARNAKVYSLMRLSTPRQILSTQAALAPNLVEPIVASIAQLAQ